MMCAAPAAHAARASRAGSIARRSACFDRIDRAATAGRCAGCSAIRRATLLVAVGDARAHGRCSTSSCPKGFFPVQDTGVILGISEAPQSISFAAMAERQQALAAVILKDPAVESLSSFIGVDGTNTTLNSGRIQINLKPLDEREAERRARSSAGCSRSWPRSTASRSSCSRCRTSRSRTASAARSTSTASRTPTRRSSRAWAPRLVEALRALPELRDVASDQQNEGLQARARDRPRHGVAARHHAAAIDDTLYDAFGQRQVSTMFTQLNQYRVVLEVAAGVPQGPRRRSSDIYVRRRQRRRAGAARRDHAQSSERRRAAGDQPLRASSRRSTLSFNLAPGRVAGRGGRRRSRTTSRELGLPASIQASFQGTAQAFQASLATSRC